MSGLKVIGSLTFPDHRQVLPSTQFSGTPRSHVRSPPCPRRKTALPNPTSNLTSMVVTAPETGAAVVVALGVAMTVDAGDSALVLTFGIRTAFAALFLIFISKR